MLAQNSYICNPNIYTHKMKRYIFSVICMLITTLYAYPQEAAFNIQNSLEDTTVVTPEPASKNLTNPYSQFSMASTSSASGFSENTTMPFNYKQTKEWGKYKALRAVGWSAFGVGVPATLVGLFICALAVDAAPEADTAGAIVTVSGGALTLSSIPILISAYHYRSKAKKMALNVGVRSINAPSFSNKTDYTPALSLALNF